MTEYGDELARLRSQTHLTADGQPIEVGQWYWDNDLKIVKVVTIAKSWNTYQGDQDIQVWHEVVGLDGRGCWQDSLVRRHDIGRLAKYWQGRKAMDPRLMDLKKMVLAAVDEYIGEIEHGTADIPEGDHSSDVLEDFGNYLNAIAVDEDLYDRLKNLKP